MISNQTAAVKRVLVVDDEPVARLGLRAALEGAFAISEVGDGVEAWEELVSGPQPDVMILDINMPRLSGLELLRRLEAAGRRVPTIVVSGYGDRDVLLELLQLRVADYLDKPLDPNEVRERVAALVAAGSSSGIDAEVEAFVIDCRPPGAGRVLLQRPLREVDAEPLRAGLIGCLDAGARSVIVDLDAMPDIDPVCLGVLLAFAELHRRERHGERLELRHVSPQLGELLRLTGAVEQFGLTVTS